MGWQWRKGWLHHAESRRSQTWVQKRHKCLLVLFPGCNPVSAFQNTVLLFCNLLCTLPLLKTIFPFPISSVLWANDAVWVWGEHLPKRHLFQLTQKGARPCREGHRKRSLTFPLAAPAVSVLIQVPTALRGQVASTDYCPLLSTPPQPGGNDICRMPI